MRTRDPFGEALAALRKLLARPLPPGRRLPVADIAADLNLSTSPVREALSRLCGEGLIEDRRGQGYFTRVLPVEDILGLLALERTHLVLAHSLVGGTAPASADDVALERWMAGVMARCENQPLVESFARVQARLRPLRALSEPVRRDAQEAQAAPEDALEAYYDRRVAEAAGLASRLRRTEPEEPAYMRNTV